MFWHEILYPDILHDKAYSGSAMHRRRPNGCKAQLASTHACCQVFASTYAASDMVSSPKSLSAFLKIFFLDC